jgi:tetratricopeptide (TPR) repeat protein
MALNGILGAHIALGTADEAAEALEVALLDAPNSVELLSMLARAYVAADDPARAEEVTKSLVLVEDSSYPRFLDVAQLYLNEDKTENTVKILSDIADHVLAAGEVERFMRILDEILARNPEHIEGLKLLVRVYKWQCDDSKTRTALERLVEAAEAMGHVDVERHALAQLAQLVPDVRYLDRLEAIGGAPHEMFGETNSSSRQDIAAGVPTFESFALVEEETVVAKDHQEVSFETFETNGDAQAPASPDASFADLNEGSAVAFENLFETNSADSYVSSAPTALPTEKGSSQDALVRQELESVDFYIAQGYLDIAADTLDMLERQFGAHPSIEERRQLLGGGGDAGPKPDENSVDFSLPEELAEPVQDDIQQLSADAFMFMPETDDQVPETSSQADFSQNSAFIIDPELKPATKPGGIDPGLAAIFDEFREAMEDEDEPAGEGDFETHYNMGLAYKEMDLADQAVEEFQQAAGLVSPGDGTARYLQCCNMLGHCFMQKQMPRLAVMWFKKGLDLPAHSEDEYQALRYELGIAYELSGELDKAIDVFTEVYGVDVSYRGVAGKLRELQAQRAIK